jgi:hypothetical protein
MKFKALSLWAGIFLIVVPLAYASGLLNQIKPNDLGEMSRGVYRLISIIAGCEMDNKCVQTTLAAIIKNDNHPVYEDYLEQLNSKRDQIEFEQMHCNSPAIRAYRRELTTCLTAMLKTIDPKLGITFEKKQQVEGQLNSCMKNKMEQMAKSGNVYAQSALMNDALKNKDFKGVDRWYNAVQLQQTKVEYSNFKDCQTPLQMFELLPSQSIISGGDK